MTSISDTLEGFENVYFISVKTTFRGLDITFDASCSEQEVLYLGELITKTYNILILKDLKRLCEDEMRIGLLK